VKKNDNNERCGISPVARGAIGVGLAALLLMMVGACSGAPKKLKVIELTTEVTVAKGLNPDVDGRPSPLKLIIYQLGAADQFQNADFFTLFDPQNASLGADLLGQKQMTLAPGEDQELKAEFDPDTAYIGVVGAFRDLENAQWRALVEIPEKTLLKRINIFKDDKLRIDVGDRSVAAAIGKQKD